jgi:alkanesulfonate monooxygenase SsuD/methylene tetrahydromethanopterin reductase-like flavin-dependent oxidoreductase (luciferase family)
VTWPQWLALARACEEHGVGTLWRSDHYLPLDGEEERDVLDAWGTICALAAVTTKLELGTLVSPATFRHPANLAKLAATADQISGGRVTLGLGAGWHEAEHATFGFPFPPLKERMDRFAGQLEAVRGFWGPDSVVHPKPQRPRLIVGGDAKPRSLRLAARFADEYNTVYATPEQCRERRAAWDAACGDRRKPFSVMLGAVIGVDRVMVQLLLHDDLEQVALLAELAG